MPSLWMKPCDEYYPSIFRCRRQSPASPLVAVRHVSPAIPPPSPRARPVGPPLGMLASPFGGKGSLLAPVCRRPAHPSTAFRLGGRRRWCRVLSLCGGKSRLFALALSGRRTPPRPQAGIGVSRAPHHDSPRPRASHGLHPERDGAAQQCHHQHHTRPEAGRAQVRPSVHRMDLPRPQNPPDHPARSRYAEDRCPRALHRFADRSRVDAHQHLPEIDSAALVRPGEQALKCL